MNRILQRFERAKILLQRKIDAGEIVCRGDRIVFQTADDTNSAKGCMVALGFIACLLIGAVHSDGIIKEASWVFSFFIVAICVGLCWAMQQGGFENGVAKRFTLFEIDTTNETILLPMPYPYPTERRYAMPIAEIYCFYGWHLYGGENREDYVYSADEKNQTTVIQSNIILADNVAQWLGFLCDKPAYQREVDGTIGLLTDFIAELNSALPIGENIN